MNHCQKCGRCCWDWQGDNPADKCPNLADDLSTCRVYDTDKASCGGLAPDWPEPRHAVDLHPDCGYVQHWREQGVI